MCHRDEMVYLIGIFRLLGAGTIASGFDGPQHLGGGSAAIHQLGSFSYVREFAGNDDACRHVRNILAR